MKPRHLLIALMLCLSFTVVGLQPNNAPVQHQSQQQTVEQLQKENEDTQKQLTVLEKELDKYREDIRLNLSIWFSILTIIMALLGAGLGIVMPYIINSRSEKQMQQKLNEVIGLANIASEKAHNASKQAENVSEQLKLIEELKEIIDGIKEEAEKAAQAAKASELFSQALAEEDPQKAIELYSIAIKLRPDFSEAFNNRGILYKQLGDVKSAMRDY